MLKGTVFSNHVKLLLLCKAHSFKSRLIRVLGITFRNLVLKWFYRDVACHPFFYPYTSEITCSNRGLSLFSYDDDMALDFPDEPSLTIERQYLIDFGSRISN